MQTELVRQIANEALAAAVFDNWVFYALLGGLTLLTSAVGAYAGAYWKRRAETAATERDMHAILDQLKQTTRVAEEVRAQVSHADWVAREWRTIRRTKLEEILVLAVTLDEMLEAAQQRWIYQKDVTVDVERIDRFNALASLYFPELEQVTAEVVARYREAYSVVLNCSGAVREAAHQQNAEDHRAALRVFTDSWGATYPRMRTAVVAFEMQCVSVMQVLARAEA